MPTTSEHNVSCTWKDLRFIDEHQKSEIGLLETLMNILNASYYYGDYQVIDNLLERVEHLMFERFRKEEEKMRRQRYSLLEAHTKDHQVALSRFMNAQQRWKRDRDQIQLRWFLERDHYDWYSRHWHYHDHSAAGIIL
jgi:hemerythrin